LGRYLFRLPDIGEGVAEAEIVAWRVNVGEQIGEDQSLVDVMTDKATVDISSPVQGLVTATHGKVGAMMPVGSVLVELEVDGTGNAPTEVVSPAPTAESVVAKPSQAPSTTARAASPSPTKTLPEGPSKANTEVPAFATRPVGDAPLAAPATRRRAYGLGIPLQFVSGTGPGGRITPEDLEDYVASGSGGPAHDLRYAARHGVEETRIIGLRRRIAEKMQESTRRIPHFTYVEECDVSELEALRVVLNANRAENQTKLTLLPFLMRALVRVIPEFPNVNAHYDDEAGMLRVHEGVHIGIATQTSGGLMVPVVHHTEARDLWSCAGELARVTAAARDGSATREELSGSTITLTSLGALGGVAATPVINHPEVAIIGPNRLVERPVVRDGQVVVRKMMNLSSSFDHRIVDGYDAARFIQAIKRLIEHPALVFMD
jgi:2-oxoisovalerate dehydrogenase E2 component (dihydrolipoyl transacylase)